ncbi:MAG: hypothetical protein JW757_12800 [Anaerolineales bacterium]|nr:hypothetical protein [Anaerolineales bacterium]
MQATKLQPDTSQVMRLWAGRLQQWRVHQIAAVLLEAGGPLKIIGAQLVFVGQPLFSGLMSKDHLDLLAGILEEPEKTETFVQFLREEAQA